MFETLGTQPSLRWIYLLCNTIPRYRVTPGSYPSNSIPVALVPDRLSIWISVSWQWNLRGHSLIPRNPQPSTMDDEAQLAWSTSTFSFNLATGIKYWRGLQDPMWHNAVSSFHDHIRCARGLVAFLFFISFFPACHACKTLGQVSMQWLFVLLVSPVESCYY